MTRLHCGTLWFWAKWSNYMFFFTNCWIYMSIFLCARFDIGGSSAHAKRAVYSYLDGLRLCDMLFWGHSILFCVHFVCEGDWICERVRGLPCSRLIWSHVENLRKKYFDFETICNPSMTTWSLTFSRYTPRLLSIPESLGDQSGNQYVSHILLLQKRQRQLKWLWVLAKTEQLEH